MICGSKIKARDQVGKGQTRKPHFHCSSMIQRDPRQTCGVGEQNNVWQSHDLYRMLLATRAKSLGRGIPVGFRLCLRPGLAGEDVCSVRLVDMVFVCLSERRTTHIGLLARHCVDEGT